LGYNAGMDEPIRVRCLACQARLELPPRATYAACRKCGSEYLVSRRGGAYALQPLAPEEVVLTQQVAAVEREQEMGCANTALSLLAGIVILFCVVGGLGQVLFNNRLVCVGSWVVALALVVPGAIVMLRNLQRDGQRKARLLAHPPAGPDPPMPAEDGKDGPAPESAEP
jgi:DNA-directed RNA polymerase subunit RPC12/RpoP